MSADKVVRMELDVCDSTNTVARELVYAGAPSGSWVSTRRQLMGRGRQGRTWESTEGNLFLSLIERGVSSDVVTWVPLASGLGVARALQDFKATLKWPNDVWIGGRKVCGILCEAFSDAIVIGIGVNCESAPNLANGVQAVSLHELGYREDPSVLRDRVVEEVLRSIALLRNLGTRVIEEQFWDFSEFKKGETVETQSVSGVVQGLGVFGELVLGARDGSRIRVSAEDVSRVRRRV